MAALLKALGLSNDDREALELAVEFGFDFSYFTKKT